MGDTKTDRRDELEKRIKASEPLYERTFDGETWETITLHDLRELFTGNYIDVDLAIAAMDEPGHEMPGVFAWYRKAQEEAG